MENSDLFTSVSLFLPVRSHDCPHTAMAKEKSI